MHLTLGRKTAYSIEALMFLGERDPETPYKAREIGDGVHVPLHYLPQILADLVRAHFLTSEAGREGGYRLARPAEEITLLAVMRAAGGELVDKHCQMTGEDAPVGHACAVHDTWMEMRRMLSSELEQTTLANMIIGSMAHAGAPDQSDER